MTHPMMNRMALDSNQKQNLEELLVMQSDNEKFDKDVFSGDFIVIRVPFLRGKELCSERRFLGSYMESDGKRSSIFYPEKKPQVCTV